MAVANTSRLSAVLIAGPTAAGKSRLAAEFADLHNGVIVNADSMQVYRELRILTARPTAEEEHAYSLKLYGHVPAGVRHSVGAWLAEVARVLEEIRAQDRPAIIVGGTGLYFRALTRGLSEVPPIPTEVRAAWAELAEGVPTADLHRLLADRSAEEAARLRPSDRSRILRALEVLEATGQPLAAWQAKPAAALVEPATATLIVVEPDRAELYRRVEARFDVMMGAGALQEAEAVGRLCLDPELPAMKAIGVRPLLDHLSGQLSLDEAVARAKGDTRRYAKRQLTWLRHQMPDWERVAV